MAAHQGPIVENLEVTLNDTPITAFVNKLIFQEGIGMPFCTGEIEITDSAGLLDQNFNGNDLIECTFSYGGRDIIISKYVNGVNSVVLDRIQNQKTYVLQLRSANEFLASLETAARAFKGTATEVINSIFRDAELGPLDILSDAKNSGKYIAPNVTPFAAIADIIFRSFDKNDNPLFLFETLSYQVSKEQADMLAEQNEGMETEQELMLMEQNEGMGLDTRDGHTIIQSWGDMIADSPNYPIHQTLPDAPTAGISPPGQPEKIHIDHDHTSKIERIERGFESNNIVTASLESSSHSHRLYDIDKDVYANDELISPQYNPGDLSNASHQTVVNFDSEDQKILCGNNPEDNISLAKCKAIRSKATSVSITAQNCNAYPTLRPGDTVNFELPLGTTHGKGDEMLSPRYKGRYVVAGITHMISIADSNYTQHVTIVRNGGPAKENGVA